MKINSKITLKKKNIYEKYFVPKEELTCSDCGKVYGHNNTTVEIHSEICSKCFKDRPKNYIVNPTFYTAEKFAEEVLGFEEFKIVKKS